METTNPQVVTVGSASATTDVQPLPERADTLATRVVGWTLEYAVFVVLLVVIIVAAITYDQFLTWDNIRLVLLQNAGAGILAVGVTFLMVTGAFDLSVVPVFVAGSVTYAQVSASTGWFAAILVAIAVGMAAGVVNGFVINVLRVNFFMATLATASVFTGIVQTHMSTNVFNVPLSGQTIGTGSVAGIPTPVIILVVTMVIGQVVLSKTRYGRSLFAVGGNAEAARLAGLPIARLRTSAYMLVGATAAFAGLLYAARIGSTQATDLTNQATLLLDVIAIVVIGGTSLFGGDGSIWRTAIGLAIFAILNNVFTGLNTATTTEAIVKGLVVILAVAADAYTRARR